jgi:hypothetical protein
VHLLGGGAYSSTVRAAADVATFLDGDFFTDLIDVEFVEDFFLNPFAAGEVDDSLWLRFMLCGVPALQYVYAVHPCLSLE